jgi:hypothetical protein
MIYKGKNACSLEHTNQELYEVKGVNNEKYSQRFYHTCTT